MNNSERCERRGGVAGRLSLREKRAVYIGDNNNKTRTSGADDGGRKRIRRQLIQTTENGKGAALGERGWKA